MHGFHQQCIGKPKKLARLGMIGLCVFFCLPVSCTTQTDILYSPPHKSWEQVESELEDPYSSARPTWHLCMYTHTHTHTRLKVWIVLDLGDTSWIVMSCHDSSGVSWDVLACFNVSCWRFGEISLSPCAGSTHERFELYNTKPWWKALPRSHLEMWWKIWKLIDVDR